MFQQVTNLRFSTDQGKWKPEIPVHPQGICLEGVDKDAFPQTYLSALVLSDFLHQMGFILRQLKLLVIPYMNCRLIHRP